MPVERFTAVKELIVRMNPDPETPERYIWFGNEHVTVVIETVQVYAGQFPFITILLALMFLDVITGYIAAGIANEVDSTVSYRGALKKCQMLLMVAAGMLFELINPGMPWGRIVAGFLSIAEFTSILENMGRSGVPLPQQLKDTLARLKAKDTTSPQVKVEVHADHLTMEGERGPKGDKGERGDRGDDSVTIVTNPPDKK